MTRIENHLPGLRRAFAVCALGTAATIAAPSQTINSSLVEPAVVTGQKALRANYGKLPLSFESNQGQTDPRVKFIAHGPGYDLFFTGAEAVVSLGNPAGRLLAEASDNRPALRLRLVGSDAGATITGMDELPGKSNYFIDNDPAKWLTGVRNYAKVKYQQVYPGVDIIYYGNQNGQLEYDFVVAPGADATAIRLDVGTGTMTRTPLRVAADGDLIVEIGGGQVRVKKPAIYQTDSTNKRQSVEGHYTLDSQNHVGIQVAPYNHSKALFIDPVLSYSTYLGGSSEDYGNSIAVDSAGSTYIAGFTYSNNFPALNGYQGSLQGAVSAFVAKLSADGSSLVYSTYLGGSAGASGPSTAANGIAVDSNGNAYITGYTTATNFPTQSPFQGSLQGDESAFVSKLSADGSSLIYSTYLGGPDTIGGTGQPPSPASNSAAAIAVDSSGSAYVTGITDSTDFPTVNAFQGGCVIEEFGNCPGVGFVTKLTPDGSSLVYSTYLQGSENGYAGTNVTIAYPTAIAVDSSGSAYITGETDSPVFPVTQNAFQQSCLIEYFEGSSYTQCYPYAFVTKLSVDGSSLIYSTYLGGQAQYPGGTEGSAVAVDSVGHAYVAGSTESPGFPTANPFQASGVAGPSAFVTELTADGSGLVYSTYLGGTATGYGGPSTSAAGIAIDSTGDAYVIGSTNTTDFPTVNPIQATCGSCDESYSAFVTKFNPGGSTLAYSTYLGGSGDDNGSAIAVDSAGNAYVTGNTQSSNFPTVNPIQATYAGGYGDAFVAKISTVSPVVSLSPMNLSFAPQPLGTASGALTETVTNTGSGSLTISTVTIGGANAADFSKSADTCTGASVVPNGACLFNVTFTPSIAGPESGSITIVDNAGGSPQTVSLNGTGTAPVAGVTPSSLTFGSQPVDTQSASQNFALNNTGNSALSITSIAFTGPNAGDFGTSFPCGVSVPAGGSCTFSVWFIPMAPGSRAAALTITDNSNGVPGSQQSVALTGLGSGPTLSYSPTSLAFGRQTVGTTSTAQSVTLTNLGNAVLTITNLGTSGANPGDFGLTTTCGGTVAVNGTCIVSVTFTPTAAGSRTASLIIADNASGSPQIVSLSGTGLAAQTFTTLWTFDGTSGANPYAGLTQGLDGNLYGTTQLGGSQGLGTVFKMSPAGALRTIYSFCAKSGCADGSYAYAGLLLARNGDFYGTTQEGGLGCGTVFEITPAGILTTLHSFNCADGQNPTAGVIQATNGNFYGTTAQGGAYGQGAIFTMTASGALTTLYSFCAQSGCPDGQYPYSALIQATNGDFYGTTYRGGTQGMGTLFRITPQGALTTLYSFCTQSACADGSYPAAGLVQATNGNLYGVTEFGGANGDGTIFRTTPDGALVTLYSFCSQGGCTDGQFPYGGLVQAGNGALYGTASGGGPVGATVFDITAKGKLTALYSFVCPSSTCAHGEYPFAGLVQSTNGVFYGTTELGGTYGQGTIFSLSEGLGRFVELLPTSGAVGSAVKILGTSLTGATSVTFDGVAAGFTVKSSSEITTVVPAGATTGTVRVVTPKGTISSNVLFRVP